MNKTEKLASVSLASIFALRMLGLFMILPVFSLYASKLHLAKPFLIGLALGIYGLTQALCQIPFGMLSDRFGRKTIISIGLIIFSCGSLVAAISHNIYGVILGRALQGAGAIGGPVNAFLSDLTREENRTKAMAIVGSMIGFTFLIAMVSGPILNTFIGVSGIFYFACSLGIIGLLILFLVVPKAKKLSFHRDTETLPSLFKTILKDSQLKKLNLSVLISHAILTASFIAIPISMQTSAFLPESKQGYVYVPVLIIAFMCMIPMIITAEKKRKMKLMFLISIFLFATSELLLFFLHNSLAGISFALLIFFTAFSFLEASLPSMVSKQAPVAAKGTAMGLYSTTQFFGMFVGGSLGGYLYAHHHLTSIYFCCSIIAFLWLFISFSMTEPQYLKSLLINLDNYAPNQNINNEHLEKLTLKHEGIAEARYVSEEKVLYIKFDDKIINEKSILQFIESEYYQPK